MSGELDPRLKAELENRLREEALGRIFRGLSPEAMRTLRAVSEMRNRSPQDVLRDELEGYILEKLPPVDVEGIIRWEASSISWAGCAVRPRISSVHGTAAAKTDGLWFAVSSA